MSQPSLPSEDTGRMEALAWMLLALLCSRVVSLYCFYLYDDAFITFRYAANLAAGNGFVYNLGERVQGITTPLWGLLLAVVDRAGFRMEPISRGLSILCETGVAAMLITRLTREKLPRAALLAGFLFALDLYLAKAAVGGMESSLFLLLTVAAALACLAGRDALAAALAEVSVFVRPEGLLFALCLLLFTMIERRRVPWRAVLLGTGIILCGVALQYGYYGDLIPQSVRGKLALTRELASVFNLALFPRRDPLQLLLTLTMAVGLPVAWRRSAFVRLYGLWALALLATWFITGAHLWMWYCVPLWFFKAVVTGVALDAWIDKAGLNAWAKRSLQPMPLALVVIIGWTSLVFVLGPDRMERNMYSKIRAWADGQDFAGQTAYGMDFGAFGFYTGLRILDEPGLVYPAAITKYQSDLKRILLGERPDWAFVTRYQQNIAIMRSPELVESYAPVWRVSLAGDTALDFPLYGVPETWHDDFVLYKRIAAPLTSPPETIAAARPDASWSHP